MNTNQEQRHPQEYKDRQIVNVLLKEEPTDYNLVELARLRIRYLHFPGARTIQSDLELILQKWQLTEEQLYEKTRQIHASGQIYREGNKEGQQEDWT